MGYDRRNKIQGPINAGILIFTFWILHPFIEIVCINTCVFGCIVYAIRLEETAICVYILKNIQSQCRDVKIKGKKFLFVELYVHFETWCQILFNLNCFKENVNIRFQFNYFYVSNEKLYFNSKWRWKERNNINAEKCRSILAWNLKIDP